MSEEAEARPDVSEAAEARAEHVRAIAITTTAALAGVAAAIISSVMGASAGARDAQVVMLAAAVVQLPVYEFLFDEWGGAKDVLYVVIMTFIMWFVTWGIVLSSGAEFA